MRKLIKLKDLQPNPFKKFVRGGQLNTAKIARITESAKSTSFWDGFVARPKDGEYELAFGHHRLAVAISLFGKNHEASVQIEPYTDDQMLRAMANENADDETSVSEQRDTIVYVLKFLLDHPEKCPRGASGSHGAACISAFLGADNWPVARISGFLQIADNIPDEVLREELPVKTLLILKNLAAPVQIKLAKMIAKNGKNGKDIGAREVRTMVAAAEGKPEAAAVEAARQVVENATGTITTEAKKKQLKEFADFLKESDALGRQFAGRLEKLLDPDFHEAWNDPIYRKSEFRQRLEATCRRIQRYSEKLAQEVESKLRQKLLTGETK